MEVNSAGESRRRYLSTSQREALRRDAPRFLGHHRRGGARSRSRGSDGGELPRAPPLPPPPEPPPGEADDEVVDPVEIYMSALRGDTDPLAAFGTVAEVLEVSLDQADRDIRRGVARRATMRVVDAEVQRALADSERRNGSARIGRRPRRTLRRRSPRAPAPVAAQRAGGS